MLSASFGCFIIRACSVFSACLLETCRTAFELKQFSVQFVKVLISCHEYSVLFVTKQMIIVNIERAAAGQRNTELLIREEFTETKVSLTGLKLLSNEDTNWKNNRDSFQLLKLVSFLAFLYFWFKTKSFEIISNNLNFILRNKNQYEIN